MLSTSVCFTRPLQREEEQSREGESHAGSCGFPISSCCPAPLSSPGRRGHFLLCSGLPVSCPTRCLASGSTGWLDGEDKAGRENHMLEAVISLSPPAALPHCPPLGGGATSHSALGSQCPAQPGVWLQGALAGLMRRTQCCLFFFKYFI